MNPAWLNTDKSLATLRTPSCLLLNEKKEFEAYGYDAEKLYTELVKEKRETRCYYFRRFKPKLLNVQVKYTYYTDVTKHFLLLFTVIQRSYSLAMFLLHKALWFTSKTQSKLLYTSVTNML